MLRQYARELLAKELGKDAMEATRILTQCVDDQFSWQAVRINRFQTNYSQKSRSIIHKTNLLCNIWLYMFLDKSILERRF